jgi:hypothetical protein
MNPPNGGLSGLSQIPSHMLTHSALVHFVSNAELGINKCENDLSTFFYEEMQMLML